MSSADGRRCAHCGKPGASWARGVSSDFGKPVALCQEDQKELKDMLLRHAVELKSLTTPAYEKR